MLTTISACSGLARDHQRTVWTISLTLIVQGRETGFEDHLEIDVGKGKKDEY